MHPNDIINGSIGFMEYEGKKLERVKCIAHPGDLGMSQKSICHIGVLHGEIIFSVTCWVLSTNTFVITIIDFDYVITSCTI